VGDRGRTRHDPRLRSDPPVTLRIGTLTDDSEIGSGGSQGGEKAVDVPPDTAAVGGNGGRVDEHTGRHD
jgi:hypothetical protein